MFVLLFVFVSFSESNDAYQSTKLWTDVETHKCVIYRFHLYWTEE